MFVNNHLSITFTKVTRSKIPATVKNVQESVDLWQLKFVFSDELIGTTAIDAEPHGAVTFLSHDDVRTHHDAAGSMTSHC